MVKQVDLTWKQLENMNKHQRGSEEEESGTAYGHAKKNNPSSS